MAGVKQHHISFCRPLDALSGQSPLDVLRHDHIADRQTPAPFIRQHMEENATREEDADVMNAQLFETIRAAQLVLLEAVVVDHFAADERADMPKAVELGSHLHDYLPHVGSEIGG